MLNYFCNITLTKFFTKNYLEISCQKSNICDMHASCQIGEGGHSMCVCNSGYEGDGIICTPSGECGSDSNCGLNERCTMKPVIYIAVLVWRVIKNMKINVKNHHVRYCYNNNCS